MSWLRLDDKFPRHPKITRLDRRDRWTWLEVLCYCAEYHTDGYIPDTIREAVPKATDQFLERCYELDLLDVSDAAPDGKYRVHDWQIYNGDTIHERVFAYLADHPEATANAVQKYVGGNRKVVLAAVRDWYSTGSQTGSTPVPGGSDRTDLGGSRSVTRARSPSPISTSGGSTSREDQQPAHVWQDTDDYTLDMNTLALIPANPPDFKPEEATP